MCQSEFWQEIDDTLSGIKLVEGSSIKGPLTRVSARLEKANTVGQTSWETKIRDGLPLRDKAPYASGPGGRWPSAFTSPHTETTLV